MPPAQRRGFIQVDVITTLGRLPKGVGLAVGD